MRETYRRMLEWLTGAKEARLGLVALLAFASVAASGGCPYDFPPEIQNLAVSPSPAQAGVPVRVTFTLSGSGSREVITWTAAVAENPQAGGSIPVSGQTEGRSTREDVSIVYTTRSPTNATITINASASKGQKANPKSITVQVQ